MTQETEREKFESVLGAPPDGCIWSGSGYYQTSYHNWKAQEYSEKWKGWRARAALEAKQTGPTLKQIEDYLFAQGVAITPLKVAQSLGLVPSGFRQSPRQIDEALQAQVQMPEPDECQYRMKPAWDEKHPWTDWKACTVECAANFERITTLHDWKYEVRRSYTEQQMRAMSTAAPARKPLSDAQIEELPAWKNFVGLFPESRKEIARAVERAHGITGGKDGQQT